MAAFDVSAQLLPLTTLAVIRNKPSHGYEVRDRLTREGFGEFKSGTIYPLLKRLENVGAISSNWVLPDSGAARKQYSISDEGEC